MTFLIDFSFLTILLILILTPILIFQIFKKSKRKYFYGISTLIITTVLLFGIFAWWSDFSDTILLGHYGYNFDGMNNEENYQNVNKIDLQKVQEIEKSRNGIGWPLKAIIMYPLYLSYSLVAFLIAKKFKKTRLKI